VNILFHTSKIESYLVLVGHYVRVHLAVNDPNDGWICWQDIPEIEITEIIQHHMYDDAELQELDVHLWNGKPPEPVQQAIDRDEADLRIG
jgi:hypothetical protein